MLSGLPLPVAAAVLGSAVLHATWNALAKAIPHRLLASALMGASYLIFGAVWCAVAPLPEAPSWPYLATSALLQTGYLLLLTAAYAHGEFRRVYPVARGTAPLLVTIVSVTVLGEHLHAAQLAGIALVAAALGVLVLRPARGPARRRRGSRTDDGGEPGRPAPRPSQTTGLMLAVATGVVIAAYSLVDGLGVRHSGSAAGYAAWLMAVQGPLLVITCLLLAGPRQMVTWLRGNGTAVTKPAVSGDTAVTEPTASPIAAGPAPTGETAAAGPALSGDTAVTEPVGSGKTIATRPAVGFVGRARGRPATMIAAGAIGGVLSLAAYAIVLWAQDRASLALVSATRETSVLFAGVIGAVFFAEGFSTRQTVAAASVVAGIVLMQIG